jgi:hypothetical protein
MAEGGEEASPSDEFGDGGQISRRSEIDELKTNGILWRHRKHTVHGLGDSIKRAGTNVCGI